MVCSKQRRFVKADGNLVGSYTFEDVPILREGLMQTMQQNKNPALSAGYQEILFNFFTLDEHGQGADGLAEAVGF